MLLGSKASGCANPQRDGKFLENRRAAHSTQRTPGRLKNPEFHVKNARPAQRRQLQRFIGAAPAVTAYILQESGFPAGNSALDKSSAGRPLTKQ
jgi:hypothetical protein